MSVPLTDDSCDDDAWLKPTDMHATRRCFLACRLSFLGLPQFIQHSTFALHEIIYIYLLDLYWSIICCYNYLETIRLSPNTGNLSNLSEIARHNPENTHQHTIPSHPFNTSTMGWFGGSSAQPTPPPPAPSQDGGFIAPDRTARAQCWDGRDSFFKCLDRHSIIDSVREDEKARNACAPELREFESACASSWVRTIGNARARKMMVSLDAIGLEWIVVRTTMNLC